MSHEVFVIHSPLDNKQTRCYERFLEELALEHLDQMLNSDIWFLLILVLLGCVWILLLLKSKLLLLKESNFVTLLQGELGILAIDTLGVDCTTRLLYLG